jgi:hypothetical protein
MSMGIIFMGDMNSASGKKALSSTTKKASNVSQNIDGVKVEGMFSKYRMKITAPYFVVEVWISIEEFTSFDSNVKIG